jgi:hypothetical protein
MPPVQDPFTECNDRFFRRRYENTCIHAVSVTTIDSMYCPSYLCLRQVYTRVQVICNESCVYIRTCTVPTSMTGTKSRTLELLAFDEYCRFDTSACARAITRGVSKRQYSSKAKSSNVRDFFAGHRNSTCSNVHTAFVTNNLYSSVHWSKTQVERAVHHTAYEHVRLATVSLLKSKLINNLSVDLVRFNFDDSSESPASR